MAHINRTTEQWETLLRGLKVASNEKVEEVIANRILDELTGYTVRAKGRTRDVKELGSAIRAYARLLQEAGVEA